MHFLANSLFSKHNPVFEVASFLASGFKNREQITTAISTENESRELIFYSICVTKSSATMGGERCTVAVLKIAAWIFTISAKLLSVLENWSL